ncbi:fumarylacetoacetate hydrolase family protein [Halioxenophilus aromaticivorans]|uniref:Fumarylacetoacetate hydrolase family protein n=1 Tax=Halioxenophilus aromaticivorans TaxID=1306992 RepID=A0AAV3U2Q4_9ALTE
MKFASLANGTRDGLPVLVNRALTQAVAINHLAPSLRELLENWQQHHSELTALGDELEAGKLSAAISFNPQEVLAPLPRAWQWLDGSLFLNHGELMQKAFHLEPIADADTIPLVYQGASDDLKGPGHAIECPSVEHGIDFEGEFAVIVDEVPMGTGADNALDYVRLIMLVNDVSLRALAPREMKTGFGFVQAKPATSFSAVAITPDELGDAWRNGRVCLPLHMRWNEQWFGHPNGEEMHFGFHQLISHAAATRTLSAGTIIGSGTVSTQDRSAGSACISERRALDVIEHGEIRTPFMQPGDRVQIYTELANGEKPFGAIDQRVALV